jgi:trans-2,3-dihydro-3-hydroxyanthranilate isomerase
LPDPLPFYTCDVFTIPPYAGNPLAIVEQADGLSTQQMQTIAREFNLSETIFVQTPDNPAHSAKVRIFFPTAEIPFAGHPTIGCAIHLALKSAPQGDFETQIILEEVAGLVPVRVWRKAGQIRAQFRAPVLPDEAKTGSAAPGDLLAKALDLDPAQITLLGHTPAVYEGGPRFLYIPVCDLQALAHARPIEPYWSQIMQIGAVDSAYLYTSTRTGFRARMYSPTAGIPEDPATGSASAIFAAQLLRVGALSGDDQFLLEQGVDMGRPSQIELQVKSAQGTLEAVYVAGSAVPISSGTLIPPV